MIFADWVKRKQEEVLSWQINNPDDSDDGGFRAEKSSDMGGAFTTADTLHTLLEYKVLEPSDIRIQKAKDWLLQHRNLGGDYGDGWPLINRGNSFVDTTSMAILALAYFPDDPEVMDAITKAKDWLLENQNDDYGWGIWKYEDSLVSATSLTLLALKEANKIFHEEKIESAIQNGTNWLKMAQNPKNHLWGFTTNADETNNASTCQAVTTLIELGEPPSSFKDAINAFFNEFKKDGCWHTVQECYTLKYFGEGLDQRLSWFIAPKVVSALILFARSNPKEVGVKEIIDSTESLKKFEAQNGDGKQVTDISLGLRDIRPWASSQYLRGLMDSQAFLQEHLDDYVSIMSGKLALLEKAGMLHSLPIKFSPKKQTSVYVSGKFLVGLIPAIGLAMLGISYLAEVTSLEIALTVTLFSMYMLTFAILWIGYKQKVVSKSRFAFLYFPMWALIVLATGLFFIERAVEGLIVLLLIGFPEILHYVMSKQKGEHSE